ncbi:MAG: hypothetical protein ACFFDN_08110 [Candidatus Hodarchaeota archaeon]
MLRISNRRIINEILKSLKVDDKKKIRTNSKRKCSKKNRLKKKISNSKEKYSKKKQLNKRISDSNKIRSKRKISNSKKIILGCLIGLILFGSTFGILSYIRNANDIRVKTDICYILILITSRHVNFRIQVTSNTNWWGSYGEGYDYSIDINKPAGSYNLSITGNNAWGHFKKNSEGGYIEVALYVDDELIDYDYTSKANDWASVDKDKPLTNYDILLLLFAMDLGSKSSIGWYCWIIYTKPPM